MQSKDARKSMSGSLTELPVDKKAGLEKQKTADDVSQVKCGEKRKKPCFTRACCHGMLIVTCACFSGLLRRKYFYLLLFGLAA